MAHDLLCMFLRGFSGKNLLYHKIIQYMQLFNYSFAPLIWLVIEVFILLRGLQPKKAMNYGIWC